MIAMSLNQTDKTVHVHEKALSTQLGWTHGARCARPWFRTAYPLVEHRSENWITTTICLEIGTWLSNAVMHSKYAAGMANSVDPEQTAPVGAVCSGYALFLRHFNSIMVISRLSG